MEEEQHVVLVDLQVVPRNKRDDLILRLPEVVVHLLLLRVQHVLEQSVVQVDLSQIGLLEFLTEALSQVFHYISEQLLRQVEVVNKDLQQVLYSHLLVGLDLVLLGEKLRFKPLLARLDILAQSLGNLLNHVQDSLLVVTTLSDGLLTIVLKLEEFGNIELEALHLLFDVLDLLVNDVQGSQVVSSVLYLDLDEQFEVLAKLRQLLSMLNSLRLLSAHLNSRIYIEDTLASGGILSLFDQLRDLVVLLELDVAVEQQGRVILVVVSHGVEVHAALNLGRFNESLQVLDEVGQVLHLDEPLNHVRRIQVADGLDVLFQGLLWLPLIQIVGVLLAYLGVDLPREVVPKGKIGSLREHVPSLEQHLYLVVVVDLVKLVDDQGFVLFSDQEKQDVHLSLDLDDLLVSGLVNAEFGVEVINLDLLHVSGFLMLHLDDVPLEELDHLGLLLQHVVELLDGLSLVEASLDALLLFGQRQDDVTVQVAVHSLLSETVALVLISDHFWMTGMSFVLIHAFVEDQLVGVSHIEVVSASSVALGFILDEEHAENLL